MTVVDIGQILAQLTQREDAAPTRAWALTDSPYSAWALLNVAAGERWEAPESPIDERQLLVLEGKATCEVDEWRQTLGSGHLLTAEPGANLLVINEGSGAPFIALLGTTSGPSALHRLLSEEE